MINFKLLILVLGVVRISYACKLVETQPEPAPEIAEGETEDVPEVPEVEAEPEEEKKPEDEEVPNAEEEPKDEEKPKEEPVVQTVSQPVAEENCNLFLRDYRWALQDCVCRPFQNECCMNAENTQRLRDGKTRFEPTSEETCKIFIPYQCPRGVPVVAQFPIPAPCGCNGKPGSIVSQQFPSLCHLLKYAAENRKPFLSYSESRPKKIKKKRGRRH